MRFRRRSSMASSRGSSSGFPVASEGRRLFVLFSFLKRKDANDFTRTLINKVDQWAEVSSYAAPHSDPADHHHAAAAAAAAAFWRLLRLLLVLRVAEEMVLAAAFAAAAAVAVGWNGARICCCMKQQGPLRCCLSRHAKISSKSSQLTTEALRWFPALQVRL